MEQAGSQRQKQKALVFNPESLLRSIAQETGQEVRQEPLPWMSTGRVYRLWLRAKVTFCSFNMFDLSAFWTTT